MNRAQMVTMIALVLTLSACAGGASTGGSVEASTPAVSATSDETASPLFGSWTNVLSRKQVSTAIQDAGLGEHQKQFFAHEADVFHPDAEWNYTFGPGAFAGGWRQPDGSWSIGYKGTLTLDGDTVVLNDSDGGFDSTFTWQVSDGHLELTFVENNATNYLFGVPAETFDIAYMTPESFVATDCSPSNGFCE